jgi:hypothetical protein
MSYIFSMRIRPSALAHLVTKAEIRAVVSYLALKPRIPGSVPVLFIGPPADKQPWIEVIADLANTAAMHVFHAMMLRPSLVASLGLDRLIEPKYAPQRA